MKFRCETCGRQHRRKASFSKHSANCVVQRHFICSKCGSTFGTLRELQSHHESQRIQTGGQSRPANGNVEIHTIHPTAIDKFDLIKFLANVQPTIECYIVSKVRQQAIKWYIVGWLVVFFCFNGPLRQYFSLYRGGGWSGGAKVLGKLPVLGGVVGWCDGAG